VLPESVWFSESLRVGVEIDAVERSRVGCRLGFFPL